MSKRDPDKVSLSQWVSRAERELFHTVAERSGMNLTDLIRHLIFEENKRQIQARAPHPKKASSVIAEDEPPGDPGPPRIVTHSPGQFPPSPA